ncbi:M20/M25/M40 family metallo-hydrolase [Acuticoccus yangtzensis]|uniref:M20/M25/M40 family metallo-hydrolase n=1 Tax=Acuticoccus yangtzensis TaxID=1443441 RepID=UPI0009495027|nr:M20/M25/M40 family metallo-hydrolase [Acuticoccus yangtzensis]ORE92901.1 peptidase [Stappia sp. 22II-S9-Z10]
MTDDDRLAGRKTLLDWIEADRDNLIDFLSRFVKAASPNPPGDTRAAAAVLTDALSAEGLPFRIIAPQETMPNIIGAFEGARPGRHLVLNGHIDVFPAADAAPGERDPWSGAIEDGKLYGRGVADMKCGTAASVIAYRYLYRMRDRLAGRLTLTAVSDEETGGRWGARYLMENMRDEVLGDCCLNGEPSGIHTLRFGDKGTLRYTITARTRGAHGAYPHLSKSATKIMVRIASELELLEAIEPALPEDIRIALEKPEAIAAVEASLGEGATRVVPRVTVNIGMLNGGIKVNVLPDECQMQIDVRIPPGVDREQVRRGIGEIVARYPEATMEEHIYHSYPSSVCDPNSEMVRIIQDNVEALMGHRPPPIISLGGADTRFWRWEGVDAYLYGPNPQSMGRRDEHVTLDEFLHIVRTHTLSAFDYLSV